MSRQIVLTASQLERCLEGSELTKEEFLRRLVTSHKSERKQNGNKHAE